MSQEMEPRSDFTNQVLREIVIRDGLKVSKVNQVVAARLKADGLIERRDLEGKPFKYPSRHDLYCATPAGFAEAGVKP